eukprot:TRINITY_DN2661_c0_g1_i2.p1 TRINITY_DN2661_c0_g1~~TRINITY_DN2661_c0_g1_i2.p1  ORF type:complete len:361 (-),score=28.12 TRINITY_DN2661_c0_g1_i2:773-1855(-)
MAQAGCGACASQLHWISELCAHCEPTAKNCSLRMDAGHRNTVYLWQKKGFTIDGEPARVKGGDRMQSGSHPEPWSRRPSTKTNNTAVPVRTDEQWPHIADERKNHTPLRCVPSRRLPAGALCATQPFTAARSRLQGIPIYLFLDLLLLLLLHTPALPPPAPPYVPTPFIPPSSAAKRQTSSRATRCGPTNATQTTTEDGCFGSVAPHLLANPKPVYTHPSKEADHRTILHNSLPSNLVVGWTCRIQALFAVVLSNTGVGGSSFRDRRWCADIERFFLRDGCLQFTNDIMWWPWKIVPRAVPASARLGLMVVQAAAHALHNCIGFPNCVCTVDPLQKLHGCSADAGQEHRVLVTKGFTGAK